jgi:hypothetical protein
VIRELLSPGLKKTSRERHESTGESLLRLAAIGGKGPTNLSTRTDDYLYMERIVEQLIIADTSALVS